MLHEFRKERVGMLGGHTGDCRCEGQDASEWSRLHRIFPRRAAGRVSEVP